MIERGAPLDCLIFEADALFLCPASFLDGYVEKLTTQDFINAASLPPPIFSRSNPDDFVNKSIFNLFKEYGTFNIMSWNTDGLCSKEPLRATVKKNFLKQLLPKSAILSLQETHDDDFCLAALLADSDFELFNNPGTSDTAAGAAILINKKLYLFKETS